MLANPSERDGDGDIDTLQNARYDSDNDAVTTFGRPASTVERTAIVDAILRYYTVAAAGNGAKACSQLDPLALEMVVERHRRGVGPPSLQEDSCAQTASKLFKQRHRELVEDLAAFRVTVIRVRGNRAYAWAPFAVAREMQIAVRRQGGVWRMAVPLDSGAV